MDASVYTTFTYNFVYRLYKLYFIMLNIFLHAYERTSTLGQAYKTHLLVGRGLYVVVELVS